MNDETNPQSIDETDAAIDEEVIEATDEAGAETTLKDKTKVWRDKYTASDAEKRKLLEELQRTKADFLNSKRRLEEQRVADVARSENKFVSALLPLADSFTMARKDTAAWEAIDEAWRKGVEGIHTQLERILSEHDVTALDPTGETFDPERHEAVGTTEHEGESDMVIEVVQLGYERNGTVLRPAKVVISN